MHFRKKILIKGVLHRRSHSIPLSKRFHRDVAILVMLKTNYYYLKINISKFRLILLDPITFVALFIQNKCTHVHVYIVLCKIRFGNNLTLDALAHPGLASIQSVLSVRAMMCRDATHTTIVHNLD